MGKKKDSKTDEAATTSVPATVGGDLYDLRTRMDRLFNKLMGSRDWNGFGGSLGDWDPWPSLRSASGEIQIPALDVVETDDAYKVTMELPGVAEDDIDVSWSNGLLSVRGEKRQDSEEKSEDRHVTERRYGSFKRPVRLPEGVEEDGLSATFKKGVLHIDVPKSTESKKGRRKIEVKTD